MNKPVETEGFLELLARQDSGGFLEEIHDAVRRVVTKVHETRKEGEVVIKIKLQPANEKSPRQIRVVESLSYKVPRLSGESLYYATDEGGMSRANPDQGRFDLKDAK